MGIGHFILKRGMLARHLNGLELALLKGGQRPRRVSMIAEEMESIQTETIEGTPRMSNFPAAAYVSRMYASLIESCRKHLDWMGSKYPIPRFAAPVVAQLCAEAIEVLNGADYLRCISGSCIIAGDLDGSLINLIKIFINYGIPPLESYVFLGNYINFGEFSLETMVLLLSTLVLNPGNIILLRGSSENCPITVMNGLHEELVKSYGDQDLWTHFLGVFSHLPYAAVINSSILCASPFAIDRFSSLDSIMHINAPPNSVCEDSEHSFYSFLSTSKKIDEAKTLSFLDNNKMDYLVSGEYQGDLLYSISCDGRAISFSCSEKECILVYIRKGTIPELISFTGSDPISFNKALFMNCNMRSIFHPRPKISAAKSDGILYHNEGHIEIHSSLPKLF